MRSGMTKKSFIQKLSRRLAAIRASPGTFCHADLTAAMVLTAIHSAVVAEGRFMWPGFGTWMIRSRRPRNILNPVTGKPMRLPASKTIGFRPARALKAKAARR